jgi:hypothetical protein
MDSQETAIKAQELAAESSSQDNMEPWMFLPDHQL